LEKVGATWYQREVVIPQVLAKTRITRFLERTKNTRVWINDTFCGWRDSDVSDNQASFSSFCVEFAFFGKLAETGDLGAANGERDW